MPALHDNFNIRKCDTPPMVLPVTAWQAVPREKPLPIFLWRTTNLPSAKVRWDDACASGNRLNVEDNTETDSQITHTNRSEEGLTPLEESPFHLIEKNGILVLASSGVKIEDWESILQRERDARIDVFDYRK